jgi:perosamine synthetase
MKRLHRAKPYFSDADRKYITQKTDDVLKTGYLSQGKYVSKFENTFAKEIGTEYGIATNSCTAALEISIRALGIKNKIILVTTNTFVASVNAIILSGNTPLIVDIDKDNLCMSKESIMDNLSENVGAILWVHMGGFISPDILEIKSICELNNIFLIEDAAHAPGASIDSINAGNIGDAGCFSFYPSKVLAIGEGGMITTNSADTAEKCKILRYHGVVKRNGGLRGVDYGVESLYPSQNFRMTEISAIIGMTQLRHLNKFVRRRNEIAKQYRRTLQNIVGISQLSEQKAGINSYWNFYFLVESREKRDKLATFLYDKGIDTANAYFPACHEQKIYRNFLIREYPVATNVLQRHLSLPMYFELTDTEIKFIIDMVVEGMIV